MEQRESHSEVAPLTISRPELLVGASDCEFRGLVHSFLAFTSIHTEIRDCYAESIGLAGHQYTILLCIRHLSVAGRVHVSTVADHLRLSGSFVTAETNKLERIGLLRKTRELKDRRRVFLELTSDGINLFDGIAPMRRQVNDVEFGCLSRDEFLALVSILPRLIQSGEEAFSLLNYLSKQSRDRRGREGPIARGGTRFK